MSITIFAKGKINCLSDIPRLIDDLKKIAEESGWKYRVMDNDFGEQPNAVLTHCEKNGRVEAKIEGSLGLKGIVLTVAQDAEAFSVLFDRDGILTGIMQQLFWIESGGQGERHTFCKTQFADIEAHISIIEVLDNLKKKYISDLTVTDEGAYWETRDRRVLAEKRIRLGHYIRRVEKVIDGIDASSEDVRDPETLASRIEEALHKADEERLFER